MNVSSTLFTILVFFGFAQQEKKSIIPETTKQFFQAILEQDSEKFQKTIPFVDKDLELPGEITPFNFALEHAAYPFCKKLIDANFNPTVQDLDRAQLLKTFEQDSKKQAEAESCIHFIEQYLQDQKFIPPSNVYRGKKTQFYPLRVDSIDYQFMQATRNGNITKMQELLQAGANPNAKINYTRPLQLAIVNTQEQALRYLLSINAEVTQEDVDKSTLLIELIASAGRDTPDILYTSTPNTPEDQATAHAKDLKKAQKIHEIILQEYTRKVAQNSK